MNSKKSVFSAFVNSYINYAITILGDKNTKNILNLQKKIVKIQDKKFIISKNINILLEK